MLTPGIGTAEKVAELSWLYCESALGCVEVEIETIVESGIGRPLAEPGKGGGETMKMFIPSMPPSCCWTSGISVPTERERSPHGLTIMPAKPWLRLGVPLSTKRVSVSGNE